MSEPTRKSLGQVVNELYALLMPEHVVREMEGWPQSARSYYEGVVNMFIGAVVRDYVDDEIPVKKPKPRKKNETVG